MIVEKQWFDESCRYLASVCFLIETSKKRRIMLSWENESGVSSCADLQKIFFHYSWITEEA